MSMCLARFQQYACTLFVITVCSVLSFSQNSHVIANSTPRLPAHAQILGPSDAAKTISITVWLKQRNKSELDQVVREMYRPGSPSYHHWLTRDQYNARYAPSAADAKAVSDFLTSRGLKVSSADKANHYVVAEGRIGAIQTALHGGAGVLLAPAIEITIPIAAGAGEVLAKLRVAVGHDQATSGLPFARVGAEDNVAHWLAGAKASKLSREVPWKVVWLIFTTPRRPERAFSSTSSLEISSGS